MHNAMAQLYKTPFFFETRLASRRFWVNKEPRHSENILAEMYYLYLSIVERVKRWGQQNETDRLQHVYT